MPGAPTLYYKSIEIASILLRRGNISSRPYCCTMIVTLHRMHILYMYIILKINCHDGTILCFTKTLELITKLAWALFVLIITDKSQILYI
jgi:hypothetical protein